MVENRHATALVIGSVLSLLATVYLSVAVGTPYWYLYHSRAENISELPQLWLDFIANDSDEKGYAETLFQLNGTLGLWWRCIILRDRHVSVEAGAGMVTKCMSFTLQQQLASKYQEPGNHNSEEDVLRTYLWRCQFLLPLMSLGLVSLAVLVGLCSCLCRRFSPMLVVGVLHLLAGVCSLTGTCCFLIGVRLLHRGLAPPEGVRESLGWSLYLALASSPLHMMAAALLLWASSSHRRSYRRMKAYRVI